MQNFKDSLRSGLNSAIDAIQNINPQQSSIQKSDRQEIRSGGSDRIDFEPYGYRIEKELGSNPVGGCLTYLATRADTNELVVIKQFKFANSGASWAGYEAYEAEMKLLQQLDLENIPRYLNSFETAEGFCLVTEYKPGISLAEKNDYTAKQVEQIAIALLEILVYLQQQNPPVIHGDIKPENILVNCEAERIEVYLVDFSWSRAESPEIAASSTVKGTLGFMPPEQIYNRQLTLASDLYSLGVTLICLFSQTKSTQIGQLIGDSAGFKVRQIAPKLDNPLIKWLQKMVAFKQKERYQDAAAALNALKSIRSTKNNKIQHYWQGLKDRKAAVWLGLGTVSAAAVIGSSISIYQGAGGAYNRLLSTGECDRCSLISADLEGSNLVGVSLEGAKLAEANLKGTNLVGAKLAGANLAGTNLVGANLQNAELAEANFFSHQLGEAQLGGANLENADLSRANLQSANLAGANLSGADLKKANLRTADLWGANFWGANLKEANLASSALNFANLKGADLQFANLAGANLERTSLNYAQLAHADLRGADLTRTSLRGADLSHADLRGADLTRVDLRGTDLSYANLKGANLRGTNLRRANTRGAIMPDGRRNR
ncbi:MAG: serine/threonine-protein kinase [Prochloraceae cyanobacterium]|nr:serine/threonine-protein kinase [Prochloraceae cyanobacterium]